MRLLSADGTGNSAQQAQNDRNKKAAAPCKEAAALCLISKMKYNDTQPARLELQFGWSAACLVLSTPAGGAFFIVASSYRNTNILSNGIYGQMRPKKGQEGDCHWAGSCFVDEIVPSPSDSHLVRENWRHTLIGAGVLPF